MDTGELLSRLRERDVRLWVEGDRLRCSAPAGVLDAEMRAVLSSRKEEILALLRHADTLSNRPPAIIPLKPDGSRPPLFAIPGHNGDVFCYITLARHLDADQPLFGVQPPGADGSDPLRSIRELARYEVDQIRRFRPLGPYLIAGYCAGGTIAFEVARQLAEQGAEVALLALFGSPFPATYRWASRLRAGLEDLRDRVGRHLRALASGSLADRFQYVRTRWRGRSQERAVAPGVDSAVIERRKRLERATIAAIRAYRQPKYPGRIDLFVPSEEWRKLCGQAHQWQAVAAATHEHVGPDGASLDAMLQEPLVGPLAASLRQRLDEIARAVGAPAKRIAS